MDFKLGAETIDVLIVIVNWNGKEDLLECLASLQRLHYPKSQYKIMVVDNASEDGSKEVVLKTYPEVFLIENPKNVGYVKAVNQGIEHSLKLGVRFVWVFNNDVVVHEDSLQRLIEAADTDEQIGVAAPIVYSYDNSQEINNVGFEINFWTGRLRKLKLGRDVFKDPRARINDITSILGCSNLIRTDIFKKVGFLRPVYELYFEETDFNVRVKKHGYRVVVVREARVWHKNASTMDRFIFRRAYLLLRNLLIFEILNAKPKHLLAFIPYYFLIHLPYFLVRGSIYGFTARKVYNQEMKAKRPR